MCRIYRITEQTKPGEEVIEALELAQRVREIVSDKKGENTILMDVREISTVTDYMLISSGTSGPHLRALRDSVQRTLKDEGIRCAHRAGSMESQWIVLEFITVVVHFFVPEVRERYSLERLWSDAIIVS